MSRYQFSTGSENINNRHERMPSIGTIGYNGARNGRSALGLVLRMINTAAQTITKANSVPMLVMCSSASIGRNPVRVATNTPTRIVDFHGVRNLGCTAAKKL